VKKQNQDRSDYPETETLVNMNNSLSEMLNEFEIQLKEKYS
jgi:hypothetical protein